MMEVRVQNERICTRQCGFEVEKGRFFKIAWTLLTLRRNMKCTFSKANRERIEGLMDWLNGSEFSANTKSVHNKILKKFYKYVHHGNADKTTLSRRKSPE